jgi:hypothetical protein
MRGKILDFSIAENLGVISGDDGARYRFAGAEWKSSTRPPVPGLRVDFVAAGDEASAVMWTSDPVPRARVHVRTRIAVSTARATRRSCSDSAAASLTSTVFSLVSCADSCSFSPSGCSGFRT